MKYSKALCAASLLIGPLIGLSTASVATGATDQERTVNNTATAVQSVVPKAKARVPTATSKADGYYASNVPESSCSNSSIRGVICWVGKTCSETSSANMAKCEPRALQPRRASTSGCVSKTCSCSCGYETHKRSRRLLRN